MASASEAQVGPAGVAALGEPRPLELADLERATATIARAFAWHEPWGEWAMPDPRDREQRMFQGQLAEVRDRFLPHGECWTIGGRSVTLWIPPRQEGHDVFVKRRSEADYARFGAVADAMRAGDELIASLKPPQPHWYLDTIATDPDFFGRGLAGRLLAHNLALRDVAGDRCALDTHTPRQVAFYERFGFARTGGGRLGPGLDVVMMVREPRRPA